jgi:hypothetical protein
VRAQFAQEPRIFHCDDRLRREVLQQCDLLVGERADFLTIGADSTNQTTILAQRDGDICSRSPQLNEYPLARIPRFVCQLCRHIRELDDIFAVQHSPYRDMLSWLSRGTRKSLR